MEFKEFIKFHFIIIFISFSLFSHARTWTDTNGTQVEADLIKVEGQVVFLKKQNGKVLKVSLKKLIKKDQDFIKKHQLNSTILTVSQLKSVYGVYPGVSSKEFLKLHGGTTRFDKFSPRNWILPKKAKVKTSFLSLVSKKLLKEECYDLIEVEYFNENKINQEKTLRTLQGIYGKYSKAMVLNEPFKQNLKVHYYIWSRLDTSVEFISWESGKSMINFFTKEVCKTRIKDRY